MKRIRMRWLTVVPLLGLAAWPWAAAAPTLSAPLDPQQKIERKHLPALVFRGTARSKGSFTSLQEARATYERASKGPAEKLATGFRAALDVLGGAGHHVMD